MPTVTGMQTIAATDNGNGMKTAKVLAFPARAEVALQMAA
jgi:hypothetical protein